MKGCFSRNGKMDSAAEGADACNMKRAFKLMGVHTLLKAIESAAKEKLASASAVWWRIVNRLLDSRAQKGWKGLRVSIKCEFGWNRLIFHEISLRIALKSGGKSVGFAVLQKKD